MTAFIILFMLSVLCHSSQAMMRSLRSAKSVMMSRQIIRRFQKNKHHKHSAITMLVLALGAAERARDEKTSVVLKSKDVPRCNHSNNICYCDVQFLVPRAEDFW